MHVIMIIIFAIALPPAAKTLIVIGSVYAIMFAAKQNASIAKYLTGWAAVVVNVILTALGLLMAIPADQLYTLNTFTSVVIGVLGSSGIHGMVNAIPATKATQPSMEG